MQRMGVRVDVRRAARECMRAGSLTSAVVCVPPPFSCKSAPRERRGELSCLHVSPSMLASAVW